MSSLDFLPGAWREPIYFEDFLIEVWRFQSVGRDVEARELLAAVWSWGMDAIRDEQDVRLALRLLDRLGLVTDDPEGWEALPATLAVYRAESGEPGQGLCWTLDREIAEMHAKRHGLSISQGAVAKSDVLAYITARDEEEIVFRRP